MIQLNDHFCHLSQKYFFSLIFSYGDKNSMTYHDLMCLTRGRIQKSYNMELIVNDEEFDRASRHLSDELMAERQKAEDAYGQLSYEKNLCSQYQTQIAHLAAGEAKFNNSIQEVLQVTKLHCLYMVASISMI